MKSSKKVVTSKPANRIPVGVQVPPLNPIGRSKDEQREHHRQSLEFLEAIFLVCPETGDRQLITNVLGARGHYTIFTKGNKTAWMHQVKTTEL